jgi:ATP-dependent Clp protease ATP-binding subunit ClpC
VAENLDRFTKRARRVLTHAQEEARRLNHRYIGTEHILLGLMAEEGGVAMRILQDLGVSAEEVRSAVERTVGKGNRPSLGQPTLTPRTKRVIEVSVEEARRLGHHYIGTEHLLLGLVWARRLSWRGWHSGSSTEKCRSPCSINGCYSSTSAAW